MKTKRLLSLALAVTMLFGSAAALPKGAFDEFASVSASAEGETSGKCGENVSWSLSEDGVLTISGTGEMTDYFTDSPFYFRTDIKSVVIESGITRIGDYAFYGCTYIKSITTPSSVTSIGDHAFVYTDWLDDQRKKEPFVIINNILVDTENCSENAVIPDGVTSFCDCAFSYSDIKSVIIPNSVTNIGEGVFAGCSNLTSVIIPNSVTRIGDSAFDYCTSLKSVSIPSSITSIGYYAFDYCTSLTSVTIPNSVTNIGEGVFAGCSNLTSVIIPNSVTDIDDSTFYGCTSLTSVTIPNSVTSIGYHAFYGCTSLTSVTIPNSVTSIGYYAFVGCDKLKSVFVPKSVTEIGKMAFGYNSVYDVDNEEYVYKRIDGFKIYFDAGSAAEEYAKEHGFDYIHIEAKPATCTADGNIEYWTDGDKFYSDEQLTHEITMADTVIKAIGHDYKETVVLPTYTEEGYTLHKCSRCNDFYKDTYTDPIGHKFSNWEQITPPTCTEKGVETRKCEYCSETETRDIAAKGHKFGYWITISTNGGTITQERTCTVCQQKETQTGLIGGQSYSDFEFKDNGDGTATLVKYVGRGGNISIPAVTSDGKKVTIIGKQSFEVNNSIRSVTIPSTVTSIEERAFRLSTIERITIPNNLTSIGTEAFCNCGISDIVLPEGVTNIGDRVFTDCRNLKSVIIPDSVTSIGTSAFWGCESLKSVTIPEGVTSIGEAAFYMCGLTSVIIPKSVNHIGKNAFEDTPWLEEKLDGQFFVIVNGILFAANPKECTGDIVIPDGVIEIGDGSFALCGITSVKIPSSVKIIGESAFYECRPLTSVTIPNSVKTIGERAFAGTGLTSITIPKAVENIGQRAFGYTADDVRISDFKIYAYKGTAGEKYAQRFQLSVNYIIDDPTRLAGAGRYATAVEISKAGFPDGSDTVVLAYGLNYADALAGVSLAKAMNAPILLTNLKTLPAETLAEIKRLNAKNVIILGGEGAVGAEVETALKKEGLKTERIAGATRFETATKIAEKMQKLSGKTSEDVFFVYAFNSADALSVSAVAAVKGAPVIYLKTKGELDDATADYLKSVKGSVKNAYVIGGSGVISDDMMKKAGSALGVTPTRVFGANRFETCVAVNEKFKDTLSGDSLCVATGMDFPDALAGGVFAALNKAPLFLINGKAKTLTLSDDQKSLLKTRAPEKLYVFGGTGVVPDSHVQTVAKASV